MNMQLAGSTNDELLQKSVSKYVAVKLNNGRVLSGILQNRDGEYVIKLGIKIIILNGSMFTKISIIE